jgi:peroxiredoxin
MTAWQRLLDNQRAWTTLMVSVLILGGTWTWWGRVPTDGVGLGAVGAAPRPGLIAPDFTLETLDGETITLSDLRGKGVVVNFWATWCLPCRTEMPALERTWNSLGNDGLVILAVNRQESPDRVGAFAEEFGLTFPILLDRDGSVFGRYNVQLYPTTFFIGRDGIIREVIFGGPMAETLIASEAAEVLEE